MSQITKATIGLNKLSPADKVSKAQAIKDTMQASGNFPPAGMPITYAVVQTAITNLQNAILLAVNTNNPTNTANMHEQERVLISTFNFVKAHVEFVANKNIAPATIITSAGMQVALAGGANAVTELTLDTLGGGVVQVRIPRLANEKAFVIETSTDGTTWLQANMSTLTKLKLTNLTAVTTLYVRYYAISKTGKGTISQVKTITVV